MSRSVSPLGLPGLPRLFRIAVWSCLTLGLAPWLFAAEAPVAAADPLWQSYRAHVAAAASALELGRGGEAQEWLAAAPEAYRAWEWRYLYARAHQEATSLQAGEPLSALAVSRDGRCVAAGARHGGTVRVWERGADGAWEEARALHPFAADASVYSLAFDAAGSRLAGLASGGAVVVWSADGDELLRFDAVGLGVGAVAWSPVVGEGGHAVLAAGTFRRRNDGSPYGVVQIWDGTTGESLGYAEHGYLVSTLAFSPRGDRLAAGTWSATMAVWDVAADGSLTGEPRVMEQPPSEGFRAVQSVAWSPDGGRLAVADKEGRVRLWNPTAGTVVAEAGAPGTAHGSWANGVVFAPGGEWLASASSDGTLKLWRAAAEGPPRARLWRPSSATPVRWSGWPWVLTVAVSSLPPRTAPSRCGTPPRPSDPRSGITPARSTASPSAVPSAILPPTSPPPCPAAER